MAKIPKKPTKKIKAPKGAELRLESKSTIKHKYEKSPQATRSYGMRAVKDEKGKHKIQVKNPSTRSIVGRLGVNPNVAKAHEAVSKFTKKKKK